MDIKFGARCIKIFYLERLKYMEVAERNLTKDGIFLIHAIGGNYNAKTTDPWIDKYIFPNGMLPSASQLSKGTFCSGRLAKLRTIL